MVDHPPIPCPNCQGMFGHIERCDLCGGTGVGKPRPDLLADLSPVEAVRRSKSAPKRSREDRGKLSYETLNKTLMTIERVVDALYQAGFDQALVENLDDETTATAIKRAFGVLIKGDQEREKAAAQAKSRNLAPPPPSDLLKFAREIRRLREVRNEIGRSTIN